MEDALMAKITIQGMGTFNQKLDVLAKDIKHINNLALYDAAGVVADAIAEALQQLPTHDEGEYGTEKHKLYGATPSEKQQIISNFGISRFRSGDTINTSVGFKGYVNTKSKRFNNKIPTGMLMQCIEYGTQFRRGTHTVSNAIKQVKERMTQAAQDRIDAEIQKLNI